ncbi:hypothetical protein [Stigmatella aurantiaca]|uniref:Conserved uncharacterized protein n=1 Tax=Stigmatella aurantiaca (strain DW4/3-1) TaxID=378806 RepID=Q09BY1_STIAD|nr:hypothetical protein [Stigmatella aurantiaca]ADO74425.1 conserved uncharacterized protein [Stigmatella aurantiaca DW4/3-1]EAU69304.1 hypothetical protein STIAU_8057 [Stigmatella aurantiaca DW4/3-1]
MWTRRGWMLGGSAALLGLGAFLYFASPGQASVAQAPVGTRAPDPRPRAQPPASSVPVAAQQAPAPPPEQLPGQSGAPEGAGGELEALAASLRERYGAKLTEPAIQVRMLEELMRYFSERYPDRWEEELLAFLRKMFPEMYDTLAATLRNRIDYEKWVKDNHAYLRGLSPQERRTALWDARHRLFGKDAAERIWASERKNQAMGDSLVALEAMEGANVQEKLSAYKQRLQDVYGEQAPAHLARHQQELMDRFMDLPSIQQELTAMPPERRLESLRAIRQEMGLDEEALKRWDALDRVRDERWEAGARYTAEREALTRQLSGAELEAQLQALRARYFPTEADVIAQEEASGLFRFQQLRQWGRN